MQGRLVEKEFVVRTLDRERRISGCVRSFAYWDRSLLEHGKLNAQTGQTPIARLERLGDGRLVIGTTEVPVDRFALTGDDVDITLYYDASVGEWLGLRTQLRNGRALTYLRVSPWSITTAQSTS